jgi:hypothetical protein
MISHINYLIICGENSFESQQKSCINKDCVISQLLLAQNCKCWGEGVGHLQPIFKPTFSFSFVDHGMGGNNK